MLNLDRVEQWACLIATEVFNSKAVMDCALSDEAIVALTESLMDAINTHVFGVEKMTNIDKTVYSIDQTIEDLQHCTTLIYDDKDCVSMEAALDKVCNGVATVVENLEHNYYRLTTVQRLGEIALKYIDRMNDLTEEDTAEVVLKAFLDEANPMLTEAYEKQQTFWGKK